MERRTFTREFKLAALKLVRERGVTVAQAARDLGVPGTVLRRWVQACATDSQQTFPGQGRGNRISCRSNVSDARRSNSGTSELSRNHSPWNTDLRPLAGTP